ncbi:hypothetical protein M8J75_007633 [Diaphorina citri]|nr:hypothetical protein M8J75_007633 [Diaphorina citri]
MAANPRKFSEKIALHNQKQAAETVEFEKIMKEVKDATSKVRSLVKLSVRFNSFGFTFLQGLWYSQYFVTSVYAISLIIPM